MSLNTIEITRQREVYPITQRGNSASSPRDRQLGSSWNSFGVSRSVTQFLLCAANYSGQSARARESLKRTRRCWPILHWFRCPACLLWKRRNTSRLGAAITIDADPWRWKRQGEGKGWSWGALFVNDIDLFIASTLLVLSEYYHYVVTRGGIWITTARSDNSRRAFYNSMANELLLSGGTESVRKSF